MTDRTPQRPPTPNWAGLSRSAALWGLVILVSVLLFQVMSRKDRELMNLDDGHSKAYPSRAWCMPMASPSPRHR